MFLLIEWEVVPWLGWPQTGVQHVAFVPVTAYRTRVWRTWYWAELVNKQKSFFTVTLYLDVFIIHWVTSFWMVFFLNIHVRSTFIRYSNIFVRLAPLSEIFEVVIHISWQILILYVGRNKYIFVCEFIQNYFLGSFKMGNVQSLH